MFFVVIFWEIQFWTMKRMLNSVYAKLAPHTRNQNLTATYSALEVKLKNRQKLLAVCAPIVKFSRSTH
jgi:hypothetical protein